MSENTSTNPRDERETERPTWTPQRPLKVGERIRQEDGSYITITGGHTLPLERPMQHANLDVHVPHGPSPQPEQALVRDDEPRYAITSQGREIARVTQQQLRSARAFRTQELTLRLAASLEVLLDRGGDLPDDVRGTLKELTDAMGSTKMGMHRAQAPGALEVVNDPTLHAKAVAEAMAKENRLSIPPSDPMAHDPEAALAYIERAQGQMDAQDAAYADGFAMGQRDMAEQLFKLSTPQLLMAKLREFLGKPKGVIGDAAVASVDEDEKPAREPFYVGPDVTVVDDDGKAIDNAMPQDWWRNRYEQDPRT